MRPAARLAPLLALSLLASSLVGACGAPDEPSASPPDAVVYDASAETRASTGIATWGYQTDRSGTTTFHGYDPNGEPVVEIRHVFQFTDEFTRRFAMKLTGPQVSGSVVIVYESRWQEEEQRTRYVAQVLENTVLRGGLAGRILERLGPDARTIPANAMTPSMTLKATTVVKPLEQDPKLVELGGDLTCPCQLHQNAAMAAAFTAGDCAQVGAADAPGTRTAALKPLDTRPPLPLDLTIGDNGPRVDSRWQCPPGKTGRDCYNVVDNNCHNATADNVTKSSGFVGCVPKSATTTNIGHALNWQADPTKPNNPNAFCAYNGQQDGRALVAGAGCCWEGAADSAGTPLVDQPGAKECIDTMCKQQDVWEPGQAPQAYPLGQKPPVQKDCAATSSEIILCNVCCNDAASELQQLFGNDPENGEFYRQNIADYRKRCGTSCGDAQLVRTAPNIPNLPPGATTTRSFGTSLKPLELGAPIDVAATQCIADGLASNRALAAAMAVSTLD